ncbi:nuclear transport factor 2 family protein [Pleurocapsa sp. FMAR1]|uniref:nuclear transport factor 2 family protein n=1 Tax=Pleurocapsa sp. FMAR1 TaxID=3040204 RepID=UPI0029C6781F|nr:nuclear transport factor 2 family protein [Pleurocapsa sp. FMAR1]
MNNTHFQQLIDESNIINLINRFYFSVDMRDYEIMRNCLTDRIEFDYTALFGTQMPPTADELVENVRLNHQGLRGIQHITTNHLVILEEDKAKCRVNFQAQHFLPNDRGNSLWTLGGRYFYSLVRTRKAWKIYGCTVHVTWTDGNLQIFDLAHE